MSAKTPAEIARRLRVVADLLDLADPVPLTAYLALQVPDYYGTTKQPEQGRVAAIDALAAVLGLNAAPRRLSGQTWQHEGERSEPGFTFTVHTYIAAPPVCACGAVCSHENAGRRAA